MSQPLSPKLDWTLANPIWAQALNPILANPILQGRLLTNIILVNGSTYINHGLNRNLTGWFLTDQSALANIYRSKPFNSSTLTLTSDAAVTVSMWVF